MKGTPAADRLQGESAITPSPVEREWIIAAPHAQRAALADEAGVSPLLAQLLLARGVTSAADVRSFLNPEPKTLLPPDALPGTVDAAARLHAAAKNKRRIVIYGDYDVDGVTATAILWHALRLDGADVSFYIPSRLEEGYGLNREALEQLAADGAQLIITVDCGITAVAEANRARELGIELIITDHHQPGDEPPPADAIVHPTACGDSPNPHLSGAGVALKVAWALGQQVGGAQRVNPDFRTFLQDALALTALGLIADVVPLLGENRVLCTIGLQRLRQSTNPGLRALLEVAGLNERKRLDDYDVGFMIAPRLNAVGRMGHARLAVELFTRANPHRAREIATTLDAHNRQRQNLERSITKQAIERVSELGFDRDSRRAIVLADADWHPGVIGIVAARLVDRFHRPTFLIALNGDVGQGSGRSVRHFPLHEALHRCADHLISHGGHAMAAGIKVHADHLDQFTDAFLAEADRRLTPADLRPRLHLDDEVTLAALTSPTVTSIMSMAPLRHRQPPPQTGNHTRRNHRRATRRRPHRQPPPA